MVQMNFKRVARCRGAGGFFLRRTVARIVAFCMLMVELATGLVLEFVLESTPDYVHAFGGSCSGYSKNAVLKDRVSKLAFLAIVRAKAWASGRALVAFRMADTGTGIVLGTEVLMVGAGNGNIWYWWVGGCRSALRERNFQ